MTQARSPLDDFHPLVREWFERTYRTPTPPQLLGWPSISRGNNTLVLAPTGSGKTLAAFLWAINHVVEQHLAEELPPGVRILYISPLKALNNDIERNLVVPLEGIHSGAKQEGLRLPHIRVAVRTGDTPQSRRVAMAKHPPDILITTPESLYLMLGGKQSRKMFSTVQYVIVDEIHSLCNNKRGVHLSISLERLQAIAAQEFVRIGLSATQRPLERVAAFLGGQQRDGKQYIPRPVTIVDAGRKREMDLRVECAASDFSLLPQESVWPLVFGELLGLILSHATTLIFVNNRRLAERVAAKLNELALGGEDESPPPDGRGSINLHAVPQKTEWSPDRPLALAYHGSMSRQARERMESDLKAGRIRALVATSSLELGIDIGSIDLVVQLQSPKGIARGLQRVGRSGHLVSATSKGRVFPTHREDLVESSVVARAMAAHEVEETVIPEDCLDVLAQQIVAMTGVEDWDVDLLFDLVRQSYCYRHLSRNLYAGVVSMLAGRFTHEAFRELRPRISWDKVNNMLRALPGSAHLAQTSGGTIADRGYFGVYLADAKTKVGEVDEEFVYETRTGDTFILGTNVWQVTGMDANRLTVAAAPGQPARMPFWRGEGIGRSFELGCKVGAFRRELAGRLDAPDVLSWLQHEFPIDARSAWNILEYFRKQRDVAGVIPHDRLFLVEGFRDEIGDPRVVIHSAFGRRVNGLLGLVLEHRLHELTGVEPQMLYNDDGILLRCPEAEALPLRLFDGITVSGAQSLVLDGLMISPLFGGQFRQNAGRALLMPKASPGKRTPLWLQRLRAKDLLDIARRFDDFPIVIETIREILHDILDFEHFRQVIGLIEEGSIGVATVTTEVPSPFSASLLFNFIAVYMYEWDQPKADRLSQYLSVNRELLSELIDLDSIPGLLRPEAIEAVEGQLQHSAEGSRARSPEELMELLLRLGDLSESEVIARCEGDGLAMLRTLETDGRALRVDFPDGARWIAGEDREVYRELHADPQARHVLRRYLLNHGPVTPAELARRYGLGTAEVDRLVDSLGKESGIIRGRFRPASMADAAEHQWCFRPNIERVHRQTIALLRKEISPCTPAEFTHFLLSWQHLLPETQMTGYEGTIDCLMQLQGLPLPAELWEREILLRRVRDYAPEYLRQLSSHGVFAWTGEGGGRMKIFSRGTGNAFVHEDQGTSEEPVSEAGRRILAYLEKHGASFFADLRNGTGLSLQALNNGIADLFWNGLITNDVFSELQSVKRSARISGDVPLEPIQVLTPRHNPQRVRMMQSIRRSIRQVPGWSGRWSLVRLPGVMGDPLPLEARAEIQASTLLARYGILAREFVRREELLAWPLIAAELQRLEMKGEIRRGYFIEGLSGMQYALPSAVDELRRLKGERKTAGRTILVNACDPANPFGGGLHLNFADADPGGERLSRLPSNYVAFRDAVPVLVIENHGARFWTPGNFDAEAVRDAFRLFVAMMKLPPAMRPFKEIVIEYYNGERPALSPVAPLLQELHFSREKNQMMRLDEYS